MILRICFHNKSLTFLRLPNFFFRTINSSTEVLSFTLSRFTYNANCIIIAYSFKHCSCNKIVSSFTRRNWSKKNYTGEKLVIRIFQFRNEVSILMHFDICIFSDEAFSQWNHTVLYKSKSVWHIHDYFLFLRGKLRWNYSINIVCVYAPYTIWTTHR